MKFCRYLEREGQAHAEALDFWFACEGLKKQPNKESVAYFIKAIYMWVSEFLISTDWFESSNSQSQISICRKFILSPSLPIREDLRREVMTRIRENAFDKGVFDSVQADIGKRITATTYPNFLKSDIYLNYLQQMPQDFSGSSGSGKFLLSWYTFLKNFLMNAQCDNKFYKIYLPNQLRQYKLSYKFSISNITFF